MRISNMEIENFKAFGKKSTLNLTNLNMFFGGNSSGKSSAIQTILLLKQTLESENGSFDLLTNGKYASFGNADGLFHKYWDVEKNNDKCFEVGILIDRRERNDEIDEMGHSFKYSWRFEENKKKLNGLVLKEVFIKNDIFEGSCIYTEDVDYYDKLTNDFLKFDAVKFEKLKVSKLFIKYDKRYQDILNNFYFELLELFNNFFDVKVAKARWNIDTDIFENKQRIISIFNELLKLIDIGDNDSKTSSSDEKNDQIKILVDSIRELIDKLNDKLRISDNPYSDYFQYIKFMIDQLTTAYLLRANDSIALQKIYEKFNLLQSNLNNSEDNRIREIDLSKYYDVRGSGDNIYRIFEFNDVLTQFAQSITYLGPLRDKPRSIYEYASDQNSLYVGKSGEFLPGVIAYNSELPIEICLPNEDTIKSVKFIEALNLWVRYIDIATKITTKVEGALSINVEKGKITSNILNVGIGVSQVLPVITMGLLSKPNQILIFEQPELHLHPYMQSRLMDFFIELSKIDRQIIIESHSEYFIQRLRFKILKNSISPDKVKVLFFNNEDEGVQISEADINLSGRIEYPNKFMDTNQRLIDDLLKAQMEKVLNENK